MAIHQCVFIHSPDLRPSTYTTMLKTLRLGCCPLVDTFVLGCGLHPTATRRRTLIGSVQYCLIVCVTRQILVLACFNMTSKVGSQHLSSRFGLPKKEF